MSIWFSFIVFFIVVVFMAHCVCIILYRHRTSLSHRHTFTSIFLTYKNKLWWSPHKHYLLPLPLQCTHVSKLNLNIYSLFTQCVPQNSTLLERERETTSAIYFGGLCFQFLQRGRIFVVGEFIDIHKTITNSNIK